MMRYYISSSLSKLRNKYKNKLVFITQYGQVWCKFCPKFIETLPVHTVTWAKNKLKDIRFALPAYYNSGTSAEKFLKTLMDEVKDPPFEALLMFECAKEIGDWKCKIQNTWITHRGNVTAIRIHNNKFPQYTATIANIDNDMIVTSGIYGKFETKIPLSDPNVITLAIQTAKEYITLKYTRAKVLKKVSKLNIKELQKLEKTL